jgi:hypothetical protein
MDDKLIGHGVDPLLPPARIPGTNDYAIIKQEQDKNSSWVQLKSSQIENSLEKVTASDHYKEISKFFDKNEKSVFFMALEGRLVRIGQANSNGIKVHQAEFDLVEEIFTTSQNEDYYVGENGSASHNGKWLYKFPTEAITRWPLFSDTDNTNFDNRNPLPEELAGIKLVEQKTNYVFAFAPDGEKCVVKRGEKLCLLVSLPEEFRAIPALPKDEQFEKSSSVIEHDGLYFLSDETTPIPEGGRVVSSPWEYLAQFKRCYDADNFTRETEVNLKQVDGLLDHEELIPLDRTDEINDVRWTDNESFSFMAMTQNRLLRCNVRVSGN